MKSLMLLAAVAALSISACSAGSEGGVPSLPDADLGDGAPRGRDAGRLPSIDGGPIEGCGIETCDDGLDGDCDGVVDDGCFCVPGDTSACFAGPAASRGVGVCRDGSMVCADGLEFGVWSDCDGDVLPAEESCGAELTDEDCDGAVNEGCECVGDEPVPCGVTMGACVSGLQECIDGRRGECVGGTGPGAEACNGIDDDCDGTVDESLVRGCGIEEGECSAGTETCVA